MNRRAIHSIIFFLTLFQLWGCASQVELSGRSAPGSISLQSYKEQPGEAPSLPASIALVEKRFEEPSGNRALDAGEEGALVLELRNDGLGPGKVVVRLTPLSGMEYLTFQRNVEVGELAKRENREVRIPVRAELDVEDGRREVRVEVVEEYNRASVPFSFSFDTRGLFAPEFRVIVRDYDDGRFFAGNKPDGLIQAGEMVKVVANVQNVGGEADSVVIEVQAEDSGEVRFTRDLQGNPDCRFALGKMETGENQDVEFFFFTTPVFGDPEVQVQVQVDESWKRFGTREVMAFDIGRSVRTEEVLAVQAMEDPTHEVDLVKGDLVDIEQIPQHSQTRLENGIAVIFGIENYRYAFPATYKNRDAATFYQYCREVLGIPEERILLRTDSDATKAEFDYVFEPKETANQGWLKKRLRDAKEAGEVDLIVYLAGHGFPDMATGSPYLIPHDVRPEQATNGVALEQLYRTLGEFGTRSVTVFVESCFSGVSGYDRGGEKKALAMNMNPVGIRLLRPVVEENTVVFTATSGDSPSSNRDDLKHGIFSYFALKGMGGAADGDGDGGVTVDAFLADS